MDLVYFRVLPVPRDYNFTFIASSTLSILQTNILVTLVTSEAVDGPATPVDNRPQGVGGTSFVSGLL